MIADWLGLLAGILLCLPLYTLPVFVYDYFQVVQFCTISESSLFAFVHLPLHVSCVTIFCLQHVNIVNIVFQS